MRSSGPARKTAQGEGGGGEESCQEGGAEDSRVGGKKRQGEAEQAGDDRPRRGGRLAREGGA